MESEEYTLRLAYRQGIDSPVQVFEAMAELAEGMRQLDVILAKSIDAAISVRVALVDVESGSIKAKIRAFVESIPDEGLRNFDLRKIAGEYLYRGKRKILKKLEENPDMSSHKELQALQQQLLDDAHELKIGQLSGTSKIPITELLEKLRQISHATKNLEEGETLEYIDSQGTISIPQFTLNEEFINQLLTKQSFSTEQLMILKIKKSDFLGQSRWEFRYNGHTVEAKISDFPWLGKFQGGHIDLRPGDAIKANARVTVNYGHDDEVVSEVYEVLQVLEVLRPNERDQDNLDLSE